LDAVPVIRMSVENFYIQNVAKETRQVLVYYVEVVPGRDDFGRRGRFVVAGMCRKFLQGTVS
jgi:hypothetical protein